MLLTSFASPGMDSHAESRPEPVMLIIADISGYTRYMTANAKTLAHSHAIITELIKAIINQIELPLEVAKLEGDAVFLFCRKQSGSQPWPETKQVIGKNLLKLFGMFGQKISELSRSTHCTCSACAHIESLQLKVVVHSGEALFHRVFNFVEFPEQIHLNHGAEKYEDLGAIKTWIYLPDAQPATAAVSTDTSFGSRFRQSWELFWKLWIAPITSRAGEFRNVAASTGAFGRIGFAVLTVLLTPVYVPVGTIFVLVHALRSPAKLHRHEDGHEHKSDGSCCGRH
jgi:hypothetical protein